MADPMVVTIPHKLGKDEALRRIKPALGKASASFPVLTVEEEVWSGDSMIFRVRALGQVAAGKVDVGEQSVRLAEHILNNFDIPMGFILQGKNDDTALEYTQWSSIAELTTKRYYVKTYGDQVLRGIDLMSFDLDAKTVASALLEPNLPPPPLKFDKLQSRFGVR